MIDDMDDDDEEEENILHMDDLKDLTVKVMMYDLFQNLGQANFN